MDTRGRARIGLLVPYTNSNLEPDFAMMKPDGASIHVARMGGYDEDEIPDAGQMQALGASDLDTPLSLLSGVKPDVMVYGCTSATLAHGREFDRALSERIAQQTGAYTVTAAGALVYALKALGGEAIGFASPYVSEINDLAIGFLAEHGVTTVARADIGVELSNDGQGALTPRDVFDLGMRADTPDAQVLVLSCTDMRCVETLDALEERLGKPVICSNQAMMFQVMRLLDMPDKLDGFGRLLREGSTR